MELTTASISTNLGPNISFLLGFSFFLLARLEEPHARASLQEPHVRAGLPVDRVSHRGHEDGSLRQYHSGRSEECVNLAAARRASAASRASLEHQCPALLFRLLSRVGHAIHLESLVVEERDHSPLVAELHTGRQRDDQRRSGVDRARQAVLVL